jgi:hypothetical protein
MSSIFSDPPFVRGRTLASSDFGDAQTDPTKPDVLGTSVVGQIKAFQDVAAGGISINGTAVIPGTMLSNRLVYCQAVRYRGSDLADASTIAGTAFVVDLALENGKPYCQISTAATNANAAAGREVGIVDEYLTGVLKQNDVIWIVRKGPTCVKQAAGTAITSGAGVELTGTAGKIQALASGTSLGINILGANSAATADTLVRVGLVSDEI